MKQNIKGAKKGSNKARMPVIAPDSAQSKTYIKLQYGLSEGEIEGLVDGAKSIYLDDTPILDQQGNNNFAGLTWDFRPGTNDQTYMEGFPEVSNDTDVNVELRTSPWVRSISNTGIDALRVRLRFGALRSTDPKTGDVSGVTIQYAIDLSTDGDAYQSVIETQISDKTSSSYERSHRIDLPKASTGWNIRVRRITPPAQSEYITDHMAVASYAEVIDAKFRYPNTALLGLQYDAENFSSVAKVAVRAKGIQLRVPNNYDPVTRHYNDIWDGSFKRAYSNNPAWIYYDLCTQNRYGLGERINRDMLDKASLYRLAQYCDELVSDGEGGQEPRFSCNVYIQSAEDAYAILAKLAGVFRAISYWDGDSIVCDADIPQDVFYNYTNANVIDGLFQYSGTRARDRHNVAKVAWSNPDSRFKTEYEIVRDEHSIAKSSVNMIELSAWGCTSRGQAQRAGLWAIRSEQNETQSVYFKVGLDGQIPVPGKIIAVADNDYAGRFIGGRIQAIASDRKSLTLDRDVIARAGDQIIINSEQGQAITAIIQVVSGRNVTVETAFKANSIAVQHAWTIDSSELATRKFRVMTIRQEEEHQFTITALEYNPVKFDSIDNGAYVTKSPVSLINPVIQAPVTHINLHTYDQVNQGINTAIMVISWDKPEFAVKYLVEWRKDNGAWTKVPITNATSVEVSGIYAGNYQARVTAISAFDLSSLATTSSLTELAGKQGLPPKPAFIRASGILFGIELLWGYPATGALDTAYTEIQVSTDAVEFVALGLFAYPSTTHTIQGLQSKLTQYYRARLVDKIGNVGPWSDVVSAITSSDANAVLDLLTDQLNESYLTEDFRKQLELTDELAQDASHAAKQANNLAEQVKNDAAAANENAKNWSDQAKLAASTAQSTADAAVRDAKRLSDEAKEQATSALDSAVNNLNNGITNERTDRLEGDKQVLGELNAYKVANNNAVGVILSKAELALEENRVEATRVDALSVAVGSTTLSTQKELNKANLFSAIILQKPSNVVQDVIPNYTHLSTYPVLQHSYVTKDQLFGGGGNQNTIGFFRCILVVAEARNITIQGLLGDDAHAIYLNQVIVHSSTRVTNTGVDVLLALCAGENILDFAYNNGDGEWGIRYANTLNSQVDAMYAVQILSENKADSSYVNQIRAIADNADGNAKTGLEKIESLTSRVGNNEASISNFNSTKASKDEVVAIAQNGLQSKWRADVQNSVDKIAIGGRNYFKKRNPFDLYNGTKGNAYDYGMDIMGRNENDGVLRLLNVVDSVGYYTVSFDHHADAGNFELWMDVADSPDSPRVRFASRQWQRLSFTAYCNYISDTHTFIDINGFTGQWHLIRNIKVEKGNKATDWTPAPEDVEATVNKLASDVSTTYQTKSDANNTTASLTQQLNSKASNADLSQTNSNITNNYATKSSLTDSIAEASRNLSSSFRAADDQVKTDAANDAQGRANQARQSAEAYAREYAFSKSEANNAIAGKVEEYDASLDTELPSKPLASRPNQWLVAVLDMTGRTDWSVRTVPSYRWLRKSPIVRTSYLAEGATLHNDIWVNNMVFFRTIVSVSAAKEINLGHFIGDDAHIIFINKQSVFSREEYQNTPDVKLNLPAGISTIDIAISNAYGGAGFSIQNSISSQVNWMQAPEDFSVAISNVNANITNFQQAQAAENEAQTRRLNEATSRIGSNESKISNIETTYASKNEVSSIARQGLSSEWKNDANTAVNNVQIGGRNLFNVNTAIELYRTGIHSRTHTINENTLNIGTAQEGGRVVRIAHVIRENGTYTVSGLAKGDQGSNAQFSVDICDVGSTLFTAPANGTYVKFSLTVDVRNVSDTHHFVDIEPRDWLNYQFKDIKIERGNKATDWTPAPEDVDKTIVNLSSNIERIYQTKASAESTHAAVVETLNSKASNGSVADIQNVLSTKANKDEVASIASNNLRAVWQNDAQDRVNKVNLGGSNLLIGSKAFSHGWHNLHLFTRESGTYLGLTILRGKHYWGGVQQNVFLEDGVEYTLSAYLRVDGRMPALHFWGDGIDGQGNSTPVTPSAPDRWERKSVTFVGKGRDGGGRFEKLDNGNAEGNYIICGYKLERGNKATDWSASQADADNALSDKVDAKEINHWVDLNEMRTVGLYFLRGGFGNGPNSGAWTWLQVTGGLSNRYTQRLWPDNDSDNINERTYNDAWNAWVKQSNAKDMQQMYADINRQFSSVAKDNQATAEGLTIFRAGIGDVKTYKLCSAGVGRGWAGLRNSKDETMHVTARSYGLYIFNRGDLEHAESYDVFGNEQRRNDFTWRINNTPEDRYICVVTYDEPQGGRSDDMRWTLNSIGGTQAAFESMSYRGAYILVGKKGLREGGGIELINDGAQLNYLLQFVNGDPNGFAGSSPLTTYSRANATAIEQTKIDVNRLGNDVRAAVTKTSQIDVRVNKLGNIGANLLRNSDFSLGKIDHWWHSAWQEDGLNIYVANDLNWDWALAKAGDSRFVVIQGTSSNGYTDFVQHVAVEGNKIYQISAYVATHRAGAIVFAYWVDGNGNDIGNSHWNTTVDGKIGYEGAPSASGGSKGLDSTRRIFQNVKAPSNAVTMRFTVRKNAGDNAHLWMTRAQVSEVSTMEADPVPWAESAIGIGRAIDQTSVRVEQVNGAVESVSSRTQLLESDVSGHNGLKSRVQFVQEVTNGLQAKATLSVAAGNTIGGLALGNNQGTVDAVFRANRFAIAPPEGQGGDNRYAFVYQSTATTLPNGTVIPSGLYLDQATIGYIDANRIRANSLDVISANLGSIIVRNANIGNLEIDTLKIRNGAITNQNEITNNDILIPGNFNSVDIVALDITTNSPQFIRLDLAIFGYLTANTNGPLPVYFELLCNNVVIRRFTLKGVEQSFWRRVSGGDYSEVLVEEKYLVYNMSNGSIFMHIHKDSASNNRRYSIRLVQETSRNSNAITIERRIDATLYITEVRR